MKKYLILWTVVMSMLLLGCSKKNTLDEEKMTKKDILSNEAGEVIQNKVETGKEIYLLNGMKKVTLKDLRDAVAHTMKDSYWPNEQMAEEDIEKNIGISSGQYEDCFVEYSHLKDNVDQLILIKCKEDEVSNIEMRMENYREDMIASHQDQMMNLAKAKASRIEVIDDYICFVQLGGDLLELSTDEEVLVSYCQEQNERAIDVIEKIIFK